MKTVTLGGAFAQTGTKTLTVSQIALGTANYNLPTKETHFAQMDRYLMGGGNLLDTALVYGQWFDASQTSTSELVLGTWLAHRSDTYPVISTKGAHPHLGDPTPRVTPACIREDLDKSLSHLGLPQIDLYFLHRDDQSIPVSVIMDELNRQAAAGKINLLGASNWSAARIYEANDYCVQHGMRGFDVSQICYNILHITPEMIGDLTLRCMDDAEYRLYRDLHMPVMAYTSQAGGYVSKYFDMPDDKIPSRYACQKTHRRMARIRALCRECDLSPTEVTLAYLQSQPLTVLPIIAASKPEQLEDCLPHADTVLSSEQLAFLDGN